MPSRLTHEQHVGPQHEFTAGFVARMNELVNMPSTWGASASTSSPLSVKKARASSMSYMRHGSTSTSVNPAAVNFDEYSLSSSAPAMHPTHKSMLRRRSAGTVPRTTTSETAKRPPGFRTRNASRSTASLSCDRLMTQFEMMTSTALAGSGT